MDLRLATPSDAPTVLRFIEANGFSPRSLETWTGLNMGAMTAWQKGLLVGAIPFEPREIWATPSKTLLALHETCVAVAPSHRDTGLGTQLQAALAMQRPHNADILTVFREDPASMAYRWYLKCGFTVAIEIESFFVDDPAAHVATGAPPDPYEIVPHDGSIQISRPSTPGHVRREFHDWLAFHPYANRYAFHWIVSSGGQMLLGVGKMHSATERADVLYAAGDYAALLRCAADACVKNAWAPIRFPESRASSVIRNLGLRSGWSFDLLLRPIRAGTSFQVATWNYAGIDFA